MDKYTLIGSNDNYTLIATSEKIEKKSKFISYIFKINDENDAIKYIDDIRGENRGAKHIVYIYTYFKDNVVNFRFSDDGEPKGTGTKAIYELLEKESITNICIVIVRYFGGILLGAGPLSRAYLNCARESILKCKKKKLYNYTRVNFDISYQNYQLLKGKLDKYILNEDIIDFNVDYKDNIALNFLVKEDKKDLINNLFFS